MLNWIMEKFGFRLCCYCLDEYYKPSENIHQCKYYKFSPRTKRKTEVTNMNVGDKVIAVGMGRKTKELNGGELARPSKKIPGFTGLVVDMVVMTVTEIDGDTILTKNYKFHKDDLHLVDTGRASAPLA